MAFPKTLLNIIPFVFCFLLQASEIPELTMPLEKEGEFSMVHLLAVEAVDKSWLKDKAFDKCSHGLRLIFVVIAKDPEATDFSVSPKAWVKINGTDYLGISSHLLKEKISPHIVAADLEPDFANYAQGLELSDKKTRILDIYYPGVEFPPIEKIEARIFTGWFRKGETFEFSLTPTRLNQ